jgi:hypothetical protein
LHRDPACREGVDLYHHGCWWEAHERWEVPWRRSSGLDPAHSLLRGLIFLTASHVQHVVAQPRGAGRLLERSLAHLERTPAVGALRQTSECRRKRVPTDLAGIDWAGLLAGVRRWAMRAPAVAWPDSPEGRRMILLAELPRIGMRE